MKIFLRYDEKDASRLAWINLEYESA
jgi:hypothetical protein